MPAPESLTTTVPILETSRLKLRAHCLADFPNCAKLWADPVVTQFITGKPLTEEESWARLLRYVGHWLLLGFGYWVVEEKATGNYLGEAGFAEHQRDLQPSIKGIPEIGWVFFPHAHGKGFASEAVRAALVWSDQQLPSTKTVCIINTSNLPSLRVAEKCGYRELQRTTYYGRPIIIFVRGPSR